MKKGEHNGRRTGRGFMDYAAIIDAAGNTVTVRESSAVGEAVVWLFSENAEGKDCKFHLGEWSACSPYLDVRSAKRLVEALERFIADAAPPRLPQGDGETTDTKGDTHVG